MAKRMKDKYDKYWENPEKMNMIIYIAVVVDPRHKLEYVEYVILEMYQVEKGKILAKKVSESTYASFAEYRKVGEVPKGQISEQSQTSSQIEVEAIDSQSDGRKIMKARFKKLKSATKRGDNKSELDRYLSEDVKEDDEGFNILEWWKINSPRFPILSQMARDVLAVPISTVALESTFSTGGQVLDLFRSSLTPKIAEALICTQDWIRLASRPLTVEEELDQLEKLEDDIVKASTELSMINI